MTHIVALFSRDFMKLIGIAFLLASPVAWMVMAAARKLRPRIYV
ncbi:hypothetical protein ACTJJ0_25550 [Chitinophaga sp. 22321]|nr:hypothetical protein [Chitinophaga hostae]